RISNIGVSNYMISGVQTTMYVAHSSAETRATNTLINNTSSNFLKPLRMICVNKAGSMPPSLPTDLRSSASLDHSGSASGITFTNLNSFYIYGLTFKQGQIVSVLAGGSNAASFEYFRFEKCTFINGATSGGTQW